MLNINIKRKTKVKYRRLMEKYLGKFANKADYAREAKLVYRRSQLKVF